ncbi:MAG: metallophosphoesterase family protein [Candidatus Woesearchaeota archaeon]
MKYKFAHLADCHLGSWRDPILHDLGLQHFSKVIDICLLEKVDFVLIAGDLFNNALPSVDVLKFTIQQLKRLENQAIPVYIIAGSHDYSPAGKTMLHILEETGLVKNVLDGTIDQKLQLSFITDKKTNVQLCGILGRANSLEKQHFELLDRELLEQSTHTEKIFLFHTTVTEMVDSLNEFMESIPLSFFPKGFRYYAGGHIHIRKIQDFADFGRFVYPGPVFPNSFQELEDLEQGSFVINTVSKNSIESQFRYVQLYPTVSICVDCTKKDPQAIVEEINRYDVENKIVLLRLIGKLSFSYSQLALPDFKQAYTVLKNTAKLETQEFETTQLEKRETTQEFIEKHIGQFPSPVENERELIRQLLISLDSKKGDGETQTDFEKRIVQTVERLFE